MEKCLVWASNEMRQLLTLYLQKVLSYEIKICIENEHSEHMQDACRLTTLRVPWQSFNPSQTSNVLGLLVGWWYIISGQKLHCPGPLNGSTLLALSQYFRSCMHSTHLSSKHTVLFLALLLRKKVGDILSIALLWKQHQIGVSRCGLSGQHQFQAKCHIQHGVVGENDRTWWQLIS